MKNTSPSRDRRTPYLFAYDITDDKRSHKVRRCLQRWRVNGQYSVHETKLLPYQAQELTTEVVELIDQSTDRLLVGRLRQRGSGPVHVLSRSPMRPQLISQETPQPLPTQLAAGWYLIAYDITDQKRLQQVQRCAIKQCVFAQRSVYVYNGPGAPLRALLGELSDLVRKHEDDLRLYCLNGPYDLWFPSGPLPPLAALATQDKPGLFQRLLSWVKAA